MRLAGNTRMWLLDSRREEKSRVPHTTSERRLNEDNWPTPRSRLPITRHTRSWPSSATRLLCKHLAINEPIVYLNLFLPQLAYTHDPDSTAWGHVGKMEIARVWQRREVARTTHGLVVFAMALAGRRSECVSRQFAPRAGPRMTWLRSLSRRTLVAQERQDS